MGKLYFSLLLTMFSIGVFAQGTITGTLVDGDNNDPLIGANVIVKGTSIGTITDFDGNFTLENVPNGAQTIEISYIGYATMEQTVNVSGKASLGTIAVAADAIGLSEINVVASIAIDRRTPVAVSTLNAEQVEATLGSQELPEVLNTTPGVYATKGGGGYGDSRINIRGFDQRNIAVMINGVPVNDMENGWVYWSNWAGLGDAVKTIQTQRGLGASKLAISSVGGTMNIITKTSDAKKGGTIKQELSSFGTSKTLIGLNSGMSDKGLAVSFVGSRTVGPGYVDQTYINAWSYYLSVYKEINAKHSLQFTVIGAPQQHGQRDNSKYSMQSFEDFDNNGATFNPNWGYARGEVLNQRNNYYHKPQIALNHYWNINEKNFLATSYYVSTGTGGGSGVLGSYPGKNELGQDDWDTQIAANVANGEDGSVTIMRNSVNNHFWTGLLSTLKTELSGNLNLVSGIDARYYKGEHYREVRDLLGGTHWDDSVNHNAQVGDRIAYDNDGIVTYSGLFSQLEYSNDALSAFIGGSISNTWFGRTDRYNFARGRGDLNAETQSVLGYNIKLGANYNINENHNVFINTGYYSRAPFLGFIFANYSNDIVAKINNEKVLGLELGYGADYDKFRLDANVYYTDWQDRNVRQRVDFTDANGDIQNRTAYFLIDSEVHIGAEVELKYKANKKWEIGAMASVGDWGYNGDFTADIYNDDTRELEGVATIYADGLKVSDQAQTTLGLLLNYNGKNFGFGADYTYYDNLFAQYDIATRDDATDRTQSYQLPAYGKLNARAHYKFLMGGLKSKFFVQGYNLLNVETPYEGVDSAQRDTNGDYGHGKENFKGFWTRGINFNFGLKVKF